MRDVPASGRHNGALVTHSHRLRGGGGEPKPSELGRCGLAGGWGGDYGTSENPRENNKGEERKTTLETGETGEYGGSKGGWWRRRMWGLDGRERGKGHLGKEDSGMMATISGIGGGCLRYHAHTPTLSEPWTGRGGGGRFENADGWAVGEWVGRASCREGWQLWASTVSEDRDAEGGIGGGGEGGAVVLRSLSCCLVGLKA